MWTFRVCILVALLITKMILLAKGLCMDHLKTEKSKGMEFFFFFACEMKQKFNFFPSENTGSQM